MRLVARERPLGVPGPNLLPGLALPLVPGAVDLGELGGWNRPLQLLEHAAGADCRQLRVVANEDELCCRSLPQLDQRRQTLGVGHPRLVHHDHRLRVDAHAATLDPLEQRVGRHGSLQSRIRTKSLCRRTGHRGTDHAVSVALPRARRGGEGDALARARLADQPRAAAPTPPYPPRSPAPAAAERTTPLPVPAWPISSVPPPGPVIVCSASRCSALSGLRSSRWTSWRAARSDDSVTGDA